VTCGRRTKISVLFCRILGIRLRRWTLDVARSRPSTFSVFRRRRLTVHSPWALYLGVRRYYWKLRSSSVTIVLLPGHSLYMEQLWFGRFRKSLPEPLIQSPVKREEWALPLQAEPLVRRNFSGKPASLLSGGWGKFWQKQEQGGNSSGPIPLSLGERPAEMNCGVSGVGCVQNLLLLKADS